MFCFGADSGDGHLSQKKGGLIYSSIVRSFVQNSRHRRSYFGCFW